MKVWTSIDDLLAESEAIQCEEIPWYGKTLRIFWMELVGDEAPKVSDARKELGEGADDMSLLAEYLSDELVWRMIDKGQEAKKKKEKDFLILTRESFDKLPKRLKNIILTSVINAHGKNVKRF
jgi:hypothetical protein